MEEFDAITINSGQAGHPLAKRLSRNDMGVAVVESTFVGRTPINYGGSPTKAFVGLTKNIAQAREASDYSITLTRDYKRMSRRKDEVVDINCKRLKKWCLSMPTLPAFIKAAGFQLISRLSTLKIRHLIGQLTFVCYRWKTS